MAKSSNISCAAGVNRWKNILPIEWTTLLKDAGSPRFGTPKRELSLETFNGQKATVQTDTQIAFEMAEYT